MTPELGQPYDDRGLVVAVTLYDDTAAVVLFDVEPCHWYVCEYRWRDRTDELLQWDAEYRTWHEDIESAVAEYHDRLHSRLCWTDADTSTYTAETTIVNGHVVSVCLDDEGPITPAYYWDIDNRTVDGFASSVEWARRHAVAAAREMT